MTNPATDAEIAEVERRLEAFKAPAFDRFIVEKLVAWIDARQRADEVVAYQRGELHGYTEEEVLASLDGPKGDDNL